jgi:phosphoribosylaminoimidazole carboxylase (NCAIR synthetase)
MGEGTSRRVVGVPGGGLLRLLLGREIQRKGLPFDLVDVDDPAAGVVTLETGEASHAQLEELERSRRIVQPAPALLRTLQDRLAQRSFLRSRGLPVADFRPVAGRDELLAALREFGCPALLEGQVLATLDQAEAALGAFNGHPLLLERPVDAAAEISVTAARSTTGEIRAYPAAENFLLTTVVPARIDPAVARAAGELARETLEAFQGAGVLAVGMTVDRKGAILLDDIAPGPRASGHYTIEACRTSQIEQHLRAIAGMPLGDPTLLYSAVTVGLAGAPGLKGAYLYEGADSVRSIPGASVHLYGVEETAPGRPLGHVTLVDVLDPGYRDALVHRAEHVRRMLVQKEAKR